MNEKVIVRQAYISEIEEIRAYVAKEWKLTKEYYEQFHIAFDKLWFVIGKGQISQEIYGVCGIIVTNDSEEKDAQLVLLYADKTSDDFSSVSLLKFITDEMNFRSVSSCGVRKNVVVLYKWLGFETGKMNHCYIPGYCEEFKIAKMVSIKRREHVKGCLKLEKMKNISELEKFDFDKYNQSFPRKDEWCIKHRYFEEKKHSYDIYKVVDVDGVWSSIIIMREIDALDAKSCKIVDFIGRDDDISELGEEFTRIIKESNYEFLDFYNIGISEDVLSKAGFVLHDKNDENIIPHYSEPILKENRDIYYVSNVPGMHLYVGDADQDRSVYGYMEK